MAMAVGLRSGLYENKHFLCIQHLSISSYTLLMDGCPSIYPDVNPEKQAAGELLSAAAVLLTAVF